VERALRASGWYADWLVRNGARVVAIDRSSRMVRLADERLGGRARVMQGDVSDLRNLLLSETFDVRWSFQLITPFTKRPSLIRDICARS
jgi:hypothetical protein